jgi:hypothetical protein
MTEEEFLELHRNQVNGRSASFRHSLPPHANGDSQRIEPPQTTQTQQVMTARHMSLPPNAPRPGANQMTNQQMAAVQASIRPPLSTTSSEEDIPQKAAAKPKKSGMMSLFKRNK